MASVNKVILVGNLGRDPEMRTFPSGDQVANVTIATTDRWKDKTTGENKESTEWHRVVFNGKLAEIVGQYPLLKPEPLYTEQQVRAMVAAPVLGYDSGIQTGNRVTLIFNTQEDATRWFEGFADAYDAAHGTKSIALPVPLAAAPTPPAQERKPLTDEQIEWSSREAHAACDSDPVARWSTAFARAIERAHGIGATNAD